MSDDQIDPTAQTAAEALLGAPAGSAVSATKSGRVRFGTAKTLRLHKNVFPCRIWRVNVMGNTGCTEYDERRRCTKPETLARGIEFAGKGWRAGATLSWVEVRPDDWKPSKPPEVA